MKAILLVLFFTPVIASAGIYKGNATLVIKRDKVVEFKKAVSKIIAPTRMEKANISYEAFQVLDERGRETNRFEFHELWTSERAMMVDHKENSPHMKEFFRLIGIGKPDTWVESFEVSGKEVQPLSCYRSGSSPGRGVSYPEDSPVEVRAESVVITHADGDQYEIFRFDRTGLHNFYFGQTLTIAGELEDGYDWIDGYHMAGSTRIECT